MNKKTKAELIKIFELIPEAPARLLEAAEASQIDGGSHNSCILGVSLGLINAFYPKALKPVQELREKLSGDEDCWAEVEGYSAHFHHGDQGRFQRELIGFIQSSPYAVRREVSE